MNTLDFMLKNMREDKRKELFEYFANQAIKALKNKDDTKLDIAKKACMAISQYIGVKQ